MIWFPRGSPSLACKDSALDLVTIIARIMKPICLMLKKIWNSLDFDNLTCTPMSDRDKVLSAGAVEPPDSFDFKRSFFSKIRYNIPITTIKIPPDILYTPY
jgi:hypothetical protein